MGDIYTNPPQSRNEAILRATIDGTEYTAPPQSRIEDLLIELKEAIEAGGGGGGTTVVPNPTGSPTDTLDTVKIGSTIYDIPEGSEVEANPAETASETLSKIGIDGTVYSVPNGGGGGTSDYTELSNKPQINSHTLSGNKSGADLGLVDAETGKGLSTNDFTDAYETKLDGIAAGAEVNVQANWDETDPDSDAYIQNKPTIPAAQVNSDWNASSGVAEILNKPTLGTAAAKDSTNAVTAGSTDLVESGAVKTAIDNAVASAYHAAGTAVVADLTSSLLIATNEGNVYNMTDAGTTTADFIEGAGKPIKIGDNVGICKVGNAYKFDLLSGFVDTSNFIEKSSTAGLVKNDGTIDTKTYAESANAYQIGDTAETTIDDADYFPFYDSSATAKKKTLWSNIKSVLKTYLDAFYSVIANPSGTATADLTKVQIGSTIYDVTDKDAMRGTSIKVATNGEYLSQQYFLVWENIGDYSIYKNPLQINGELGYYSGSNNIAVSCELNNVSNKFSGYLEKRLAYFIDNNTEINLYDLILTKEGTGASTHFRLYVNLYPHNMGEELQASINITPPDPKGTVYPNPTASSIYEGTIVAKLSDCLNIKSMISTVGVEVTTTGWTQDTTSQSGVTLWKKEISVNRVYRDTPNVSIGAPSGLPTDAQQIAYNLLKYVTIDTTTKKLYLYATTVPSTTFYIHVEGVD